MIALAPKISTGQGNLVLQWGSKFTVAIKCLQVCLNTVSTFGIGTL